MAQNADVIASFSGAWRRLAPVVVLLCGVPSPGAGSEPLGHGGVKVAKWTDGLAGPQGMVADGDGSVFVVESGRGRVSRFSAHGRPAALLAEGLKAPAFAVSLAGVLYVGERQGNSVARVTRDG